MIKFSIIIPTRQRYDTLKSSLDTCVHQDYENLAIIVSDNDSSDDTRSVVDSFKDRRIKYINTGKRISMSDNWEFALSHISDGYVIYLGDDDGMLPGSIESISRIIEETATEAIGWRSVQYHWPCHPDKIKQNLLNIPLVTVLEKRNCKKMLTDVLDMKRPYTGLPFLYRGAVSYRAINQIKLESGRFFNSIAPDIYSGIALSSILDTYYYSQKPYSINGASHSSLGTSGFSRNSDRTPLKEFLSEDNIPFHPKLKFAPSLPIAVAESVLQAHDHISQSREFTVDIKHVIETAVNNAVNLSEQQYEEVLYAVKEIARLNGLCDCLPNIIKPRNNKPRIVLKSIPGVNLINKTLIVDCSEFNVKNVFEASLLCNFLMASQKKNYFSFKEILKTSIKLATREIRKRK